MVRAFQDDYPSGLSHCNGFGRLNAQGLQLRSYWDGDETVAVFEPGSSDTPLGRLAARGA